MSLCVPRTDDGRMTVPQLLVKVALDGHAPMPVDSPPVGPARARPLRLMRLRESLLEPGAPVEADAVAGAIARRAMFAGELRRQLTDDV
jgi:hypothetical protein